MNLDIIIITRNRPVLLKNCLSSLRLAIEHLRRGEETADQLQAWVWVGINGKDETSETIIKDSQLSQVCQVLVRKFERKLPGDARNELLVEGNADWILFLDDDVIVPLTFLEEALKLSSRHQNVTVFGGPNLNPPGSSDFQRAQGLVLGSWPGSGPFSARYSLQPERQVENEMALTLCNLFVNRKQFFPIFPTGFTCGEETDLLRQIREAGGSFYVSPGLYVFHERRRSWGEFARQCFKYGIGRAQASAAKPELQPAFLLGGLLITALIVWQPEILLFYFVFVVLSSLMLFFAVKDRNLQLLPVLFAIHFVIHMSYLTGLLYASVQGLVVQLNQRPKNRSDGQNV